MGSKTKTAIIVGTILIVGSAVFGSGASVKDAPPREDRTAVPTATPDLSRDRAEFIRDSDELFATPPDFSGAADVLDYALSLRDIDIENPCLSKLRDEWAGLVGLLASAVSGSGQVKSSTVERSIKKFSDDLPGRLEKCAATLDN